MIQNRLVSIEIPGDSYRTHWNQTRWKSILSQMLHVWNILFTYIYPKNGPNVGKYSIHGASGIVISTINHRIQPQPYLNWTLSNGVPILNDPHDIWISLEFLSELSHPAPEYPARAWERLLPFRPLLWSPWIRDPGPTKIIHTGWGPSSLAKLVNYNNHSVWYL